MRKPKTSEQTWASYLTKPYARILTPEPSGKTYVAQILEFPGCIAEGDTPAEAYTRLDRAAAAWIRSAVESGRDVPEPTFDKIRDYSGKVALRLPRNLHREATRFAELQRTSLNTFLVSSIGAAVGAMSLYENLSERIEARFTRAAERFVATTASKGQLEISAKFIGDPTAVSTTSTSAILMPRQVASE